MKNLSGAIFDFDGTLLDSMYVWQMVDNLFLEKRGIEIPPDYSKSVSAMGFQRAAEYTVKRFSLSDSPQDLLNEWFILAIDEYTTSVCLKSGAAEYLDFLKNKGIKIAAATSSHPSLFEPALKRNNIHHYFDEICRTDQVKRGKNFPDVYLLAADYIGCSPCECIVFEDIPEGLIGAKAAGMITVAVEEKASADEKDLIISLADKYITNFFEMMF